MGNEQSANPESQNAMEDEQSARWKRISSAKVDLKRWEPFLSPTFDLKTLQEEIARMQKECSRIIPNEKFRILMCACSQHGKSSSINSMLSALECDTRRTVNDGYGKKHITQRYSEYMMLTGSLEKTPFVICDSPGFNETLSDNIQDLQTKVMEAIIMGKFVPGEEINYKMTSEELARKETKQKCAVCVFFVIDIRRVNTDMMKTSAAFQSMKNILDFVQKEDIKAAFLLTNCDNFNDKVKKKPRYIYMSNSIEQQIRIVSEIFDRFSINRIFPIVNDTERIGTNNDIMAQSLIALRQVIGDIVSYLTKRVDVPADTLH